MIGQFGVGFYAAFLVAERVQVHSKSRADQQWCWESDASGNFQVGKDPLYPDLSRGTHVLLFLREEHKQSWTEERTIRQTVKRHNEFIQYPIQLRVEKEVEEEEEGEAAAGDEGKKEAGMEGGAGDSGRVQDVTEEEEKKTAKTKVKKEDWELLNTTKPSAPTHRLRPLLDLCFSSSPSPQLTSPLRSPPSRVPQHLDVQPVGRQGRGVRGAVQDADRRLGRASHADALQGAPHASSLYSAASVPLLPGRYANPAAPSPSPPSSTPPFVRSRPLATSAQLWRVPLAASFDALLLSTATWARLLCLSRVEGQIEFSSVLFTPRRSYTLHTTGRASFSATSALLVTALSVLPPCLPLSVLAQGPVRLVPAGEEAPVQPEAVRAASVRL